MEQKQSLSKATATFMGVSLSIMGVVAILVELNTLGSILLITIGITGIAGGIMGKFEEKDQG